MKKSNIIPIISILLLYSCNIDINTSNNNLSSEYISSDNISLSISEELDSSYSNEISSDSLQNISEDSSINSIDNSSISNNKLEKLTIISINDLHGKIEQDVSGSNGISNLSYKINSYRNQTDYDDVVLIANGDMFQGQAISNLNYGLSVINAMNAMNFDIMGIGNHEFDWNINTILKYFDGNQDNGEANFPLVNANIIENDSETLLEYTKPYHIIYRENIKIGIISSIGVTQKSSILKTLVDSYTFLDEVTQIGKYAEILRTDENCDIVICNIHDGGDYKTKHNTDLNKAIANLSGSKRIDALINGHTHNKYRGYIQRNDSSISLPVVQAGSSASALGVIELSIDKETKTISSVNAFYDQNITNDYDVNVQSIVNTSYNSLKDQLEQVYCVSGENITSTDKLRNWAGSCMQKATNADISFSNNGGLRTVNLQSGDEILLSDLYSIIPFDNKILTANISGAKINDFINNYGGYNYYSIKSGITIENSTTKYYTVAVIDYLAFKDYFPLNENDYIDTNLIYRDILGEDLKIRHKNNLKFNPSTSYESLLEKIVA